MTDQHAALKSMLQTSRNQTVLTPDWIIDIVQDQFFKGWPILFDPCAAPDPATHFAAINWTEADDSLSKDWVGLGRHKIYINPPYNNLKPFFDKALDAAQHGAQVVVLSPVRTHRKFFCDFARHCEAVYALNYDVRFEGYDQSFPAPLCLMSLNCGEGVVHQKINARLFFEKY